MTESQLNDNPLSKSRIPDLIVVGGGITGLIAAYIAAKDGLKVTVLEAGKNFGGLLSTFEIGDNRLEFYYHHFFTHDSEINWLINELGIKEKLVFRKTTMGIFTKGKIYPFNNPKDLIFFKPLTLTDKARFAATSLFLGKLAEWKKYESQPANKWLKKYAGAKTTESLWDPLLKVKFGPYYDKVPLSWMIGRLRQRMNSRKSGEERLGYLTGSLQVLLDALLLKLKELNVDLMHNSGVLGINRESNIIKSLKIPSGTITGRKYLFTIPGVYLGKLLENDHTGLANKLTDIKYFGAVCVILELKRSLSNIYWLNIADDESPFGGIIEHTNFIPPENYNGSHIVYLSRYFAREEAISKMQNEELKELMLNYLNRVIPDFSRSWIKNAFVFRTNTAATVCDLNFSRKIPDCKTDFTNLFIANMSHVYPDERSTNNSIRIAAEACRVMGINSEYVPYGSSLSGKIGF